MYNNGKYLLNTLFVFGMIVLTACGGGGGGGGGSKPNQLPTANAGNDQTVEELTTVSLTGSGTDSDGNIVSYQWEQISGSNVTISSADKALATFIAPDTVGSETLVFQLTVTDDQSATATDSVSVIVNNVVNNPYKLTVRTLTKHCGQEVAFSNGEIVIHNSDGSIKEEIPLHSSGITKIGLETESVNFSVLTKEQDDSGDVHSHAVTLYGADSNGDFYFVNSDYTNLPEGCSCETAKIELNQGYANSADFDLSSEDYYVGSSMSNTIEQSLYGFCASPSDIIYAFHYDPITNFLSWGSGSYQTGINDTAFIDFFENEIYSTFEVKNIPENANLRVYQLDNTSRLYKAFSPSDITQVPVITNLPQLNKQLLLFSMDLGENVETGISNYLLSYQYRDVSTDDFSIVVPENIGNAEFELNVETNTYSIIPNEIGINMVESYLYISTNSGNALIYAPITDNQLSMPLPTYPSSYGIDIKNDTVGFSPKLRTYLDGKSYQEAIASRFGSINNIADLSSVIITQ